MAHAHNCLLRGLNSIVLQAPHVPDASKPDYNARDVKDLLKYTEAWVSTVDHHHHTEETCTFPMMAELAKEPDLMKTSQHQHAEFHSGLEKLGVYARTTRLGEYRWDGPAGMKEIIDSFAEIMVHHLHDEIDVLLSLIRLDSHELKKCFDETERVAKAQGNIGMLVRIFDLCSLHPKLTISV